jgi:uroporphyrin-III C-methyltransferase / precorrin-2 dehydrogenase / sirohydrochlorin ferrochelatase
VSPFAPSHFKTADYSTISPNSPRKTPSTTPKKPRVLTP